MIFYTCGWMMVILAIVYTIYPSKKLHYKYGYRTPRARENEKTFRFAQKCARNMLFLVGGITLLIGFLLKTFGMTQFFILEFIFIVVPIATFFYLVERKIEIFADQTNPIREEMTNETIND